MIRIVCPFCHSPLNATDLETATLGERLCLGRVHSNQT